MPVLSLLIVGAGILGATALEDFALALAAGLFIGSYSSIFVAAPLLAWWKEREPQYKALADRRRRVTAAAATASTGVPVAAPEYDPDVGRAPCRSVCPGPARAAGPDPGPPSPAARPQAQVTGALAHGRGSLAPTGAAPELPWWEWIRPG